MASFYNYSHAQGTYSTLPMGDYLLGCSSHHAATTASAANDEFVWMATFRSILAILDILYVLMAIAQKGSQGSFPSKRYNDSRKSIIVHIITGTIIIYMGTFLHVQNEFNTVTKANDKQHFYRRVLYYVLGFTTIVHSYTVLLAVPKVMGERRLTIPLYTVAGMLNFANAIILINEPTLQNAFLVWGSVNTFILVRLYLILLSFQHLDWELCYTYGIVTAAATIYPMTRQSPMFSLIFVAPLMYGPFHERFCEWVGIAKEDIYDGNVPSKKNVGASAKKFRSLWIDKDYVEKLE
jgi:hypothetical protein